MLFAFMCGGFILGIAFASFDAPWWVGGGVLGLGCWVWSRLSRNSDVRRNFVYVFFSIIFSLLGSWRYQVIQPTLHSVSMIADKEMRTLEGTIVRIQESEYGIRLTLNDIVAQGRKFEDRILVRVPLFSESSLGERVSIDCALKRPEPFEGFAYDRYLAAKDIQATCSTREVPFVLEDERGIWMAFLRTVYGINRFSIAMIDRVFPDPHAQLLAGLLLGDDAFSEVWSERFLRTGTSHIVAASGSNVALVVMLVLGGMFRACISRKYATAFALFGILCFVFLAGAESAVTRAGIMASFVVISRVLGRASSVRNVLLCTVCIMLFDEPRILRDDIGFQLSVLSTIGLIFWANTFIEYVSFVPERFGLREGFATTLAATLATLPVTLFSMGQISFVGPLANLLVLPLLPLAMGLGTLATIVGMVHGEIGRWIAFPAWWILDTILMILRELSSLSFVYVEVVWWKVVFGVLGVGGGVWIMHLVLRVLHVDRLLAFRGKNLQEEHRKEDKVNAGAVLVPCLFVVLFFISFAQHVIRDGWFSSSVRVWVFDVGQGDAIFIDTPEKDVVIDGGPSPILREKIGMMLPWFDRHLDYVFVTHPHADHVVGLVSLLEHYGVSLVGESGQGCSSSDCRAFDEVVHISSAILAGEVFELAHGITLRAVWPQENYGNKKLSDPNDGSLVFVLETPHGSMLLTGDAGIEEEHLFIPLLPENIEVLKVGHHGSSTSTSLELLEAIRPEYGIISLGEDNSYGHPHEEAIQHLLKYHVEFFQTNLSGDMKVEFGEEGVEVTSWRL
jgi:competence protein ComEC